MSYADTEALEGPRHRVLEIQVYRAYTITKCGTRTAPQISKVDTLIL